MARTGKGILDGFRGSIGQTTGSRDKGKDVIRAKPKNTPKTQTPGLTESKSLFGQAVEKGALLKRPETIKCLNQINDGKTWLNNFVSLNYNFPDLYNFQRKKSIFGGTKQWNSWLTITEPTASGIKSISMWATAAYRPNYITSDDFLALAIIIPSTKFVAWHPASFIQPATAFGISNLIVNIPANTPFLVIGSAFDKNNKEITETAYIWRTVT